jgi:hypothetical protein
MPRAARGARERRTRYSEALLPLVVEVIISTRSFEFDVLLEALRIHKSEVTRVSRSHTDSDTTPTIVTPTLGSERIQTQWKSAYSARELLLLAEVCQHVSASRECLVGLKLNRNKL